MDQKYQIGNEYGSIVWDISLILKDKHRFQLRDFSVEALSASNPFYGDKKYAMQTDLSRPLIVVNLTDRTDKLIDGNHRLYHCKMDHIPLVKSYYLEYKEHWKYIIDFDEDVYWKVVDHWI